ncbi:hypothetical protein I4F81_007762 [Pyropia yezoensis]|uniref:Uncharacterized protein n=1 Tax=Pyropia yezoensis TaxID=2788 RepID=A0ACC3C5U5_PYRYE|nr:hypothetical protein I4F81_007762 [Neopyropia yezoensis]
MNMEVADWMPAALDLSLELPSLGDAPPPSLSAAHAKRCWPAGGGWAEPTSAADLLSPGLADAVLSAAAVPGVAPDAARVIRNREVALKARQAAKDKAARLAADNAALTARVAELLAENAALSAAAASLRAQVAGGEGEAPAAGGSAQRNWA